MFSQVVELYRCLDKPLFDEAASFQLTIAEDHPAVVLLEVCAQLGPEFGHYESYSNSDGTVSIDVNLPTGGGGRFFLTLEDLLAGTPRLSTGVFPNNLYVRSIDYSTSDELTPPEISGLRRVVRLVHLLRQFAEGTVKTSERAADDLIFVLPPDGKTPQRTVLVPLKIEPVMIGSALDHLNILDVLTNPKFEDQTHMEERRLVMKLAIADVLSDSIQGESLLASLVRSWPDVISKYRHNLRAYISNFAFDAVRKKLADADVEFASKLSNVMGDIAGKLLALPLAYAALIALRNDTGGNFGLIFSSIAAASLIYLVILQNQRLQINRIEQAFDLVFAPLEAKCQSYPRPLADVVRKHVKLNRRQRNTLRWSLALFTIIAVLPLVLAVCQLADKSGFDWQWARAHIHAGWAAIQQWSESLLRFLARSSAG